MKNRLDKILATNGYGSRRDVKTLIRNHTLTINGKVCTDPSTILDPDVDLIELDSATVVIRTDVYLMLNKPAGVITSTEDPDHKTVMDLLESPFAGMVLFPVGRLDVDTEGLLIITNDGPLTHRLTSPKTGVDKTYFVRLRDPLDSALFAEYEKRFRDGIVFRDGTKCLPATISAGSIPSEVFLTIQEGKFHQVKKMFLVLENEVVYLRRVSMGNLVLDPDLPTGEYRELTEHEIQILRHPDGV